MADSQLSDTKKIKALTPMFSNLSSDELDVLWEYMTSQTYPAGGMVFSEGDRGDRLYIVKSGLVEIVKKGPDEHSGTVRLAQRGPGEIIGEMAVIEASPRFATAVCVEPTELAVMSREDFMKLVAARPDLALQVLKVLVERVKETDTTRLYELEEKNEKLESAATRLHQALKKLQSANTQLEDALKSRQQLLDVSPFPIIVADADMDLLYCNLATEKVFGVSPDKCIGHQIRDLLRYPDSAGGKKTAEMLFSDSERWNGNIEVYGKDDHLLNCYVEALPVPTDDDHTQTYLFIFHDETEIRELQQQAAERERLANKGEMAAEIAHELNNYLAVLSGNIELLPMFLKTGNPERVDKCLRTLEVSLSRMQVFTMAMLSSRLPRQEKLRQNFNRFIENQVTFLKPQRKFKKVIINTDFDVQLPEFEFDPNALQQVLYNLILNCAEALGSIPNPEPQVNIITRWIAERGMVQLEISDNGPGLDASILDQLFHKHITTKPDGHGIGLMTVKKIIEEHMGTIMAGTSAAGGAVFTIHLPVAQKARAQPTGPIPIPAKL
jgi:two-component system nitrogen regulation sensor histidine kinase GlnL